MKLFPLFQARVVGIVLSILVASLSTEALAAKFSALTVDARTGAVLFSKDADGQRYPASLTKMMTLYVVFQELKAGRITLQTPLRISRRAALMPPSKLGLKVGSTITVEHAIKALVIKSANDVAAVIGENLEGTEGAFATRMTRVAHSIGMSRTTYRNASGLPNPGQVTTARDQATLALRIMRDFPQYYPYYRATSFNYKGRTIRTHNRLVGRYQGTDGIKTGYTNASGYNLVTSTKRGDKRLVGVVLGGRTGGARNAYMVSMLTKMFPKATSGHVVAALAGSSKGAINPLAVASLSSRPVVTPSAQDSERLAEAAASASDDTTDTAASEDGEGDELDTSVLEAKLEDESLTTSSAASEWDIQVGDFGSKTLVKKGVSKLRKAKTDVLRGKDAVTEAVQSGNRTVYLARFSGFTEQAARAACESLKATVKSCAVVSPQS